MFYTDPGSRIAFSLAGIAIARHPVPQDCPVLLVERDDHVLSRASGSNSGILHCGFDADPALLEHELVLKARTLLHLLRCHLHSSLSAGPSPKADPSLPNPSAEPEPDLNLDTRPSSHPSH